MADATRERGLCNTGSCAARCVRKLHSQYWEGVNLGERMAVTVWCLWVVLSLPAWPRFPAAVDADGQITVLNGDKKMTQAIDSTPAGIS